MMLFACPCLMALGGQQRSRAVRSPRCQCPAAAGGGGGSERRRCPRGAALARRCCGLQGFGGAEAAPNNSSPGLGLSVLCASLFIHKRSQTRLRKGGEKASTDRFNRKEPQHCQESNSSAPHALFQFSLDRIPRSREVRQSWVSSVLTTLYSILYSLPLTYKRKPDLVGKENFNLLRTC